MEIAIRPATPSDAPAVARLAGELGYPATAAEIEQRLSLLHANAAHRILVAVMGKSSNGEVIGWAHVLRRITLATGEIAELVGMVVDSRHRDRGIGAELLAACETWATDHQMHSLRLRSNVTRTGAHRFYERHGYEHVKTQAAFLKRLL